MQDLISRQAAIDAICKEGTRLERNGTVAMCEIKQWCIDLLEQMPSAEPELATNLQQTCNQVATDCISRKAAIEALIGITTFKTKHELMQRVNASVQDEQGWLGAVAECLDEIEDLPSAQPEQPEQRWIPFKTRPLTKEEKLIWAVAIIMIPFLIDAIIRLIQLGRMIEK